MHAHARFLGASHRCALLSLFSLSHTHQCTRLPRDAHDVLRGEKTEEEEVVTGRVGDQVARMKSVLIAVKATPPSEVKNFGAK